MVQDDAVLFHEGWGLAQVRWGLLGERLFERVALLGGFLTSFVFGFRVDRSVLVLLPSERSRCGRPISAVYGDFFKLIDV